jgi:hypothetical protein
MIWLLFIVVLLIIVAAVVAIAKHPQGRSSDYPYTKKRALFSPAERSFLGVLDQAVGDEYRVFGKVRVADVMEPWRGLDNSARQKAFNRINAKHFDFVLCAKSDLSVVGVVELDDASHQRRKRRERDAFVVKACQAAALPLIQIQAQASYSVANVQKHIMATLTSSQTSPSETGSSAPPVRAAEPEPVSDAQPPMDTPTCPKCSAPMVLRRARAGSKAGQTFWGCTSYPKCHGILKANA